MKSRKYFFKSSLFVLCIFFFCGTKANPVDKIIIPLNCRSGVPYEYDKHEDIYYVTGFDVDEDGKMYFLGGGLKEILTCFSKNKQEYNKELKGIVSYYFYMYKDTCYIFDKKNSRMFLLSKNGTPISDYSFEGQPNYLFFSDSSIVATFYTRGRKTVKYVKYSITGRKLGEVPNQFGLSDTTFNKICQKEDMEYKGVYKNLHVFCQLDLTNDLKLNYHILLFDKSGKQVREKIINENDELFSNVFCTAVECNFWELRKLRNGKLYSFGFNEKSKEAVVASIDFSKLFPDL